ncbi:MAG TPA: MFS transporter [Streptosporangiaceae bacterium]|jgi:putative MFS transporter
MVHSPHAAEPGRPEAETRAARISARIDRMPTYGFGLPLFVIVGASYFFTFYDITAIGVTLPTLTQVMHLTGSQVATPVTANLFAYIVGAYGLATIADYIGRRRALAISVVILAIGSLATAFSWDLTSLTAFRFLTGLGMGAQISLAATIMTELTPPHLRGRGVAINVFWGGVGLGAAPWVGLGLLEVGAIGWRLVFGLAALVFVLLFALNDRTLPESPRWLALHGQAERAEAIVTAMEKRVERRGIELPPVREVPAEATLRTFPTAELLRPPYISRVAIVFFFWTFSYMGAYAYLAYQPTLIIKMGVAGDHGLLYSAIGDVAFPVGALLAALLIDRWQRKYLAACAGALGIIGVLVIAIAGGPVAIIVGSFIAGIWIMSPAYGYSYTAEVFPTRARASAMSIGDGLGHIGGAVQPYVVVAVLAAFGPRPTFVTIGAMTVVAMLIILLGGIRTMRRELTEVAA